MNISHLSTAEKNTLCAIINSYSTGQHPWASPTNLQYFVGKYVGKLLRRAIKSTTGEQHEEALSLYNKFITEN